MAELLKGVSTRSGFRNPDGNETKGTSLHISVRHAGKLPPPGCRDVTLIWRKTAKHVRGKIPDASFFGFNQTEERDEGRRA